MDVLLNLIYYQLYDFFGIMMNVVKQNLPITIGCDSEITSTAESDLTGEITRWRSKVGRPSGLTEEKQYHQRERLLK